MRNILAQNLNHFPENQQVVSLGRDGGIVNPFYKGPEDPTLRDLRPVERRQRQLSSIPSRPKSEAEQYVREIRDYFLQEISGGNSELSPEQELMMKRIREIPVNITDCTEAEGQNRSFTNEVVLCANALKMPKLALVSLIAHELAHTIDLCSLTGRRLEKSNPSVDLTEVSKLIPGTTSENLIDSLEMMSDSTKSQMMDWAVTKDPEDALRFEEIRKKAGINIVDEGIPLSQNPTLSTYQCLNRNNKNYRTLPQDEKGGCQGSIYTETSAQIWAARMTSRFIDDNQVSPEEAVGLFANCMSGMQKSKTGKEHDIDDIYFSEPRIRKLFNCTQRENQNCTENFNPSRTRSLAGLINEFSELDLGRTPSTLCE